jgi:hypothetical protein
VPESKRNAQMLVGDKSLEKMVTQSDIYVTNQQLIQCHAPLRLQRHYQSGQVKLPWIQEPTGGI